MKISYGVSFLEGEEWVEPGDDTLHVQCHVHVVWLDTYTG